MVEPVNRNILAKLVVHVRLLNDVVHPFGYRYPTPEVERPLTYGSVLVGYRLSRLLTFCTRVPELVSSLLFDNDPASAEYFLHSSQLRHGFGGLASLCLLVTWEGFYECSVFVLCGAFPLDFL